MQILEAEHVKCIFEGNVLLISTYYDNFYSIWAVVYQNVCTEYSTPSGALCLDLYVRRAHIQEAFLG
jgi:hypothetical protein